MIRITVSNRRIQVDDDKPLETVLDTNSYLNNPTVIDEYKRAYERYLVAKHELENAEQELINITNKV